ncbi:MAG: hypothetical protein KGN79_10210 [Acidobacteriota bacterium]|nr:hypothetical protein [Acidobacteriota bacterium]
MSRLLAWLLYWSPRILSILFALFITVFAFDVFDANGGFVAHFLALLLHLVPTFVLALAILLAWRWEWIGAAIFASCGLLYSMWAAPRNLQWILILGLPMFVIAALYMASWIKRTQIHAALQ